MTKKQLTPEQHEALRQTPQITIDEIHEREHDNDVIPEKPRTWRDPYNYKTHPITTERNHSPSLTIPNDSFSLRELLDRNARGLPLTTSGRQELYHGDEEMPDLAKMDLSEIHNLAETNQRKIQSYRDLQQREAENAVLAKERKLLALEQEVAAFRAKYPNTTSTDNKPLA